MIMRDLGIAFGRALHAICTQLGSPLLALAAGESPSEDQRSRTAGSSTGPGRELRRCSRPAFAFPGVHFIDHRVGVTVLIRYVELVNLRCVRHPIRIDASGHACNDLQ
jgi:hypothetical protein